MVPVDRGSSPEPARPAEGGRTDDAGMIEALRKGNEAVYRALVDRYTATLLRLASMYVSNTEVTADVTQETWIGVLQGHRQSDAVGLSSPSPSFAENRHLNGPLRLRSGVCRVRIASS